MSLIINGKVIGGKQAASTVQDVGACAAFGKDDKTKISTSKIETGCSYNSLHLGIDKMVVLLPVEDLVQRHVIQHVLAEYGKAMGFAPVYKKQVKNYGKKPKLIYKKKWRSKLTSHFYVELMPVFPGIPFIRVTWNPSKLGTQGIAIAKSQLDQLLFPNGYVQFVQDGRVSHMEVCFDAPAEKKKLSVYCTQVHSLSEYDSATGDGTLYFGKKSSKTSFKCYNRKKKLERVEKEAAVEPHLTRLEATIKKVALKDLNKLETPFTKLHVFETDKLKVEKAVKDPVSFQQCGNFFEAVKSLSHYRRKQALAHFSTAIPSWWNPKETWQTQWQNLLDLYGLLTPYSALECKFSAQEAA